MLKSLVNRLRGKSLSQIYEASLATLQEGLRESRDGKDPFDTRWGTDTARIVPLSQLEYSPEMARQCVQYQASMPDTLERAIALAGIDPADFVMVDIGSGKGRMVLCGSAMAFQRSIGVEYSAQLDAIARRNAEIFAARGGSRIVPEFHCGDASGFAWPDSALFLYFYNPFGPEIMRPMLDSIEASMAQNPRRIVFAYVNPRHADVLDARPGWSRTGQAQDTTVYELLSGQA